MNEKESMKSFEEQYNRIVNERARMILKIKPSCNFDIMVMGILVTSKYYKHEMSDYGEVSGYDFAITKNDKTYKIHEYYTTDLYDFVVEFSTKDFNRFVRELVDRVNELNQLDYEKHVKVNMQQCTEREKEFKQKLDKMK